MNRKRILYIILALVLAGAAVGYFMWNKPHKKVEDAEGVTVTATQLCKDFAQDEAKASATYAGKALEVSGVAAEIKNNQDGKPVIIMQSEDPSLSVQCTMRDAETDAETGKQVVVKGFFASNDMFGPTLTDCVIKK